MKRKHSSETAGGRAGGQKVKQKYKSNAKKRCGKRAEWEDRMGKMKGVGERRWGVGRRGEQGEKTCVCVCVHARVKTTGEGVIVALIRVLIHIYWYK